MNPFNEALDKAPAQTWLDEIAAWKISYAELRANETGQNLRIIELDYEKSKLELKVTALIRLLIESGVVDREKLESYMTVIDAEDGTPDGRITPTGSGRSLFVAAPD